MSAYLLPPLLTHAQANACVRGFQQHLRQKGAVCAVDATGLQDFDSSALAVLLDCRRQALAQGQTLRVVGLSARLQALARLYGVYEILRV